MYITRKREEKTLPKSINELMLSYLLTNNAGLVKKMIEIKINQT